MIRTCENTKSISYTIHHRLLLNSGSAMAYKPMHPEGPMAGSGYRPLREEFSKLQQEKSGGKCGNFALLHRVIRASTFGCSVYTTPATHLQAYPDEYCVRYNRSIMKEGAFENLLDRLMGTPTKTQMQLR